MTPSTATCCRERRDRRPAGLQRRREPGLPPSAAVLYTVPKIDVLLSGILRSQANVQPGGDVATNGASRSANFG